MASTKDNWAVRSTRWASDHWTSLALLLFPVCISIAGFLLSDEAVEILGASDAWSGWIQKTALVVLLVFSVAHVVFGLIHIFHERRISQLIAEVKQARDDSQLLLENARAVCDGYLQDLAGALEFGSKGPNTERITLYLHDSEKSFQPVGRFSN